MAADEVRRPAEAGVEIGSHSMDHRRMPKAHGELWIADAGAAGCSGG